MQDMLKKILAVDKKATETVEEAKKEKENVEKKLLEAKEKIEAQYSQKAESSIAEMRKEKEEDFAMSEMAVRQSFDDKISLLEEKFNKCSSEWAEEIAKRAIEM